MMMTTAEFISTSYICSWYGTPLYISQRKHSFYYAHLHQIFTNYKSHMSLFTLEISNLYLLCNASKIGYVIWVLSIESRGSYSDRKWANTRPLGMDIDEYSRCQPPVNEQRRRLFQRQDWRGRSLHNHKPSPHKYAFFLVPTVNADLERIFTDMIAYYSSTTWLMDKNAISHEMDMA